MLINLAYLLRRPTGTTTYALNLLPYLKQLNPDFLATKTSGLSNYYPVPSKMTAEYGAGGHLRRLMWTQFRLPQIYRTITTQQQAAKLMFCPIPEAPLSTRCRFVVTVHDLIPLRFPESRALTWLHRYYIPRVLRSAVHIICNSQATADDLMRFHGLPSQKITPILLAHDAEHFRPLALEKRPYFLILGRHAPYKNIAIALQAFAQFPQHRAYELWIAGPEDARHTPDLKRQVQMLGIVNQVKFLSYVPYEQLPILLNQALALIFPSLWEGFGLPVLEAMACGTPVIASKLSAIPEVTGDAAILIDPTQSAAIAQALTQVANDRQTREQLSQASIKRAAKFSWQLTGQTTVDCLKSFL